MRHAALTQFERSGKIYLRKSATSAGNFVRRIPQIKNFNKGPNHAENLNGVITRHTFERVVCR
jgi:hypothetical protein